MVKKKQILLSITIVVAIFLISVFLSRYIVYSKEGFPGIITTISKLSYNPVNDSPYYILPDGICTLEIGSGGSYISGYVCAATYNGLFLGLLLNIVICFIFICSKNPEKRQNSKYILITTLLIFFLLLFFLYIQGLQTIDS